MLPTNDFLFHHLMSMLFHRNNVFVLMKTYENLQQFEKELISMILLFDLQGDIFRFLVIVVRELVLYPVRVYVLPAKQ